MHAEEFRYKTPWFRSLKFTEWWYQLNATIGFQKISFDYVYYRDVKKTIRYRKHQNAGQNGFAEHNVARLFTDSFGMLAKRAMLTRDKRIRIEKPAVCERCGGTEGLDREHIIPLSKGGKDEPSNLRYLCKVCHYFRHAEDKILRELEKEKLRIDTPKQRVWAIKMLEHRLTILREKNPPGKEFYSGYFNDPSTHYGRWYQSPKKDKETAMNAKITDFPLLEVRR